MKTICATNCSHNADLNVKEALINVLMVEGSGSFREFKKAT